MKQAEEELSYLWFSFLLFQKPSTRNDTHRCSQPAVPPIRWLFFQRTIKKTLSLLLVLPKTKLFSRMPYHSTRVRLGKTIFDSVPLVRLINFFDNLTSYRSNHLKLALDNRMSSETTIFSLQINNMHITLMKHMISGIDHILIFHFVGTFCDHNVQAIRPRQRIVK